MFGSDFGYQNNGQELYTMHTPYDDPFFHTNVRENWNDYRGFEHRYVGEEGHLLVEQVPEPSIQHNLLGNIEEQRHMLAELDAKRNYLEERLHVIEKQLNEFGTLYQRLDQNLLLKLTRTVKHMEAALFGGQYDSRDYSGILHRDGVLKTPFTTAGVAVATPVPSGDLRNLSDEIVKLKAAVTDLNDEVGNWGQIGDRASIGRDTTLMYNLLVKGLTDYERDLLVGKSEEFEDAEDEERGESLMKLTENLDKGQRFQNDLNKTYTKQIGDLKSLLVNGDNSNLHDHILIGNQWGLLRRVQELDRIVGGLRTVVDGKSIPRPPLSIELNIIKIKHQHDLDTLNRKVQQVEEHLASGLKLPTYLNGRAAYYYKDYVQKGALVTIFCFSMMCIIKALIDKQTVELPGRMFDETAPTHVLEPDDQTGAATYDEYDEKLKQQAERFISQIPVPVCKNTLRGGSFICPVFSFLHKLPSDKKRVFTSAFKGVKFNFADVGEIDYTDTKIDENIEDAKALFEYALQNKQQVCELVDHIPDIVNIVEHDAEAQLVNQHIMAESETLGTAPSDNGSDLDESDEVITDAEKLETEDEIENPEAMCIDTIPPDKRIHILETIVSFSLSTFVPSVLPMIYDLMVSRSRYGNDRVLPAMLSAVTQTGIIGADGIFREESVWLGRLRDGIREGGVLMTRFLRKEL